METATRSPVALEKPTNRTPFRLASCLLVHCGRSIDRSAWTKAIGVMTASRNFKASPRTSALSRRAPFAGQIADRIREMIVHGDLQPDSRVVERALCEQLAVSRTPLREALKLLQAEGLVTLHQNRGARVTSFTAEQALTLFEVISGIEGLAAELACVRMSEIELASIEELHTKMKSHFELGEKEPYFELNSQIHDRIVQVSNNVELIAIHSNLLLRARRGRYMAIVDPRRWNEAMEEHEALMRAFRIRDPDLAGTVWRTHLRHTGETVGQVMTYANTLAGSTLPTEFA